MTDTAPQSFAAFWPHYVMAHRQRATRLLHCAGTLLGWALLVAAVLSRRLWLVPAALAAGYASAWIAHFLVEHNRPATFAHPLWSWLADQKMVALMLAGRMEGEVRRVARQS